MTTPIGRKDITDAMILDYLRTLNVHITKTELATAFNIVNRHLNYVHPSNSLATENKNQLPQEQDPFAG